MSLGWFVLLPILITTVARAWWLPGSNWFGLTTILIAIAARAWWLPRPMHLRSDRGHWRRRSGVPLVFRWIGIAVRFFAANNHLAAPAQEWLLALLVRQTQVNGVRSIAMRWPTHLRFGHARWWRLSGVPLVLRKNGLAAQLFAARNRCVHPRRPLLDLASLAWSWDVRRPFGVLVHGFELAWLLAMPQLMPMTVHSRRNRRGSDLEEELVVLVRHVHVLPVQGQGFLPGDKVLLLDVGVAIADGDGDGDAGRATPLASMRLHSRNTAFVSSRH